MLAPRVSTAIRPRTSGRSLRTRIQAGVVGVQLADRPHREHLLLDVVEAGRAAAVRDQPEGAHAVPVAGPSARQGVELLARLLVERPAGEEAVRHLGMAPERRLRELGEALPDPARP